MSEIVLKLLCWLSILSCVMVNIVSQSHIIDESIVDYYPFENEIESDCSESSVQKLVDDVTLRVSITWFTSLTTILLVDIARVDWNINTKFLN